MTAVDLNDRQPHTQNQNLESWYEKTSRFSL